MKIRIGYLVEYSKKKSIFDGFEPRETIICSDTKLIELLQNKIKGTVWNACWINVEEYLINHKNNDIKIYE